MGKKITLHDEEQICKLIDKYINDDDKKPFNDMVEDLTIMQAKQLVALLIDNLKLSFIEFYELEHKLHNVLREQINKQGGEVIFEYKGK